MSNSLCVYIGRFSPFHLGQAAVLERALKKHVNVLVIIGTYLEARTIKNPWTCEERAQMIKNWKKEYNIPGNLSIRYASDIPYNNTLWATYINQIVDSECYGVGSQKITPEMKSKYDQVFLTGTERDSSGFYLKMFPQWSKDLYTENHVSHSLSATKVRELYFGSTLSGNHVNEDDRKMLLSTFMPRSSVSYLSDFENTSHYQYLYEEFIQNKKYQESWKPAPYAPIFVTVDTVVVQAGHVLLVTRKKSPGKGLLALPGGFLEPNEWIIDGAIRELQEETKIELSPAQLRGSIKSKEVFDKPDRSLRGRTVTVAYLLQLNEVGKLPKIKAADDAEAVGWYTIAEIRSRRNEFFDDHYSIIEEMIARCSKTGN